MEWFASSAEWKIAPAYWMTHQVPQDKLILDLLPVNRLDQEKGIGAELRLTGEGQYAPGPIFLADPTAE